MNLFEAKAITMTFGGLTAVNKVDFNIEKGMIASLICNGINSSGLACREDNTIESGEKKEAILLR